MGVAQRLSAAVSRACLGMAALFAAFFLALCCLPVAQAAFADEPESVIAEVGKAIEWKVSESQGLVSASSVQSDVNTLGDIESFPYVDYTAHVGEILQNDVMPGGCEIISLQIVLESMGIQVDLESLVYDHLNMDGSFSTGYAGDPYWAGGGFAPGIVAAANSYLNQAGIEVRAYNASGLSFDELCQLIAHGYPVMVWTTIDLDDPFLSGIFEDDAEWYDNEHCVVLYGISEDGAQALVSDPLEGYVERDAARFADIYDQCGSQAMILR